MVSWVQRQFKEEERRVGTPRPPFHFDFIRSLVLVDKNSCGPDRLPLRPGLDNLLAAQASEAAPGFRPA